MLGLTPLGVNVTGNIAGTFSLALLTFLITNLTANKNYWGHIFWMPGVPVLIKIVLAPIEFLGVSKAFFIINKALCKYSGWTYSFIQFDRFDVYF